MADLDKYPRLIFREPFDERTAFEVNQKGWYSGLTVELEAGRQYEVFFYDPVRLSQDLEMTVQQGKPCIAEPGMIVVPEITEVSMREAIAMLFRDGWFNQLWPINLSGNE